jgi:uncharacterized repeat protein (TIGR01451 family)
LPSTDQRGYARIAGNAVDIGAYEYGATAATTDLSVSGNAPSSVAQGGQVTYTLTVSNNSTSAQSNITLADGLLANTTLVSWTAPGGWSSSAPAAGSSSGTVSAWIGSLAANTAATFTLVLQTSGSLALGTVLSNTASVGPTTGDPNPGNNSVSFQTTIGQASQTISFGPLSPVTYGVGPITLSATSSSGLPVTFSVFSGLGSISGTTLTVTGAGSIVLDANQAGNSNYNAATQVQQTLVVNQATPKVTVTGYTGGTYDGSPHTQTVTVTGVGTDGVLFTTSLPGTNAGSYSLPWSFSNANYTASAESGTLAFTISPAAVLVTPDSGQAKVYGAAVPPLTYQSSGLVGTNALRGALGTTATAASPVGAYPFALGTLTAGPNYTLALAANPPTFAVTPAALTVQAMQVNDGSAQRSMVTSLTVTFSQPITQVDVGAFEIDRGSSRQLVPASDLTIQGDQVVIRFTGLGWLVGGSLADGRYTLVEHAGLVHSGGNYVSLTDHRDGFFRLYGDVNGDGKVDASDLAAFLKAYRSRKGMANYRWYFDYNGDGIIDSTDFYQFLRRYGTAV